MNNDNLRQNAGRWVRVGFFALTTLGPIANVVASRLRERAATLQQETTKRSQTTLATLSTLTPSKERLHAVGASLSELREKPYSQELLKRGNELTDTLREQGDKLSQAVAERGSKAAQVAVERGSDIARDVATRSRKASRELARQSQQTSREVSRRTQRAAQQAQRELARRGAQVSAQVRAQAQRPDYMARFWSVFGFSVGLTSAVVGFYLLLRRRLQQRQQEDAPIQLANRSKLNGSSGTKNTVTVSPETTSPAPVASVSTLTETASVIDVTSAVEDTDDTDSTITASTPVENVPTDAPSLTATGEPLTTTDTTDEDIVATPDALPVEVPVEDAVAPIETAQEVEETGDTGNTLVPPVEAQTVETAASVDTPVSAERTYTPEDEAAAISSGMPMVSIDDTILPAEGLGTATVSGVVADDDSPTVKQAVVSDALSRIPTETLQAATSSDALSRLPTEPLQTATSETSEALSGNAPLFVGVVATKRYYPVETPLSNLQEQEGSGIEVVYFGNEDEAQAQGYSLYSAEQQM